MIFQPLPFLWNLGPRFHSLSTHLPIQNPLYVVLISSGSSLTYGGPLISVSVAYILIFWNRPLQLHQSRKESLVDCKDSMFLFKSSCDVNNSSDHSIQRSYPMCWSLNDRHVSNGVFSGLTLLCSWLNAVQIDFGS